MASPRVGVFICHCGTNIAGVVDVRRVREEVGKDAHVAVAVDYPFMCSEDGQKLIEETVRRKRLDRIVVASCSPKLHERTFRRVLERVGLNPFLLEMANIREQCSWAHHDEPEKATEKAVYLVKAAVHKVLYNEEIGKVTKPVKKAALVIGGGVAGIQAALDLADKGIKVYLVERSPTLGGAMALHDKVYPTMDCSLCILAPRMAEAYSHENIEVLTLTEVVGARGYVGNFRVKLRRRPRYVDVGRCTACGLCAQRCPTRVPNEFNAGLGERKAIYIPFQQAVPRAYVIDPRHCLYINRGVCRVCERVCPAKAINFDDREEEFEVEVGAIVIATGFREFDPSPLGNYGYGRLPDVVTNMQLTRILHPEGPTGGKLVRPSDGRPVETLVFVQCVGSRDERFHRYCSRVCCMASLKLAYLVKAEKSPKTNVYICYVDMRAYGKGYEEFLERVKSLGVVLIRGKPSEVTLDRASGKLRVRVLDTVVNKEVEILADMVSLAAAVEPPEGVEELAKALGVELDSEGFFKELHPKLNPVETKVPGIYVCGAAAGPADIPESVAQAKAAASAAATLLLRGEVEVPLDVASVNEELCTGCGLCTEACPYGAIELVEAEDRRVARVEELACKGCGACAAACPAGAVELRHYRHRQVLSQVEGLLGVVP